MRGLYWVIVFDLLHKMLHITKLKNFVIFKIKIDYSDAKQWNFMSTF